MARDEDETKAVIRDRLLGRVRRVGEHRVFPLKGQGDLPVLVGKGAVAPEAINRLALADCRQPCARIRRGTVARPLPQRVNERVLRKFLSEINITSHPCQRGDYSGKLHAEDGLDGG